MGVHELIVQHVASALLVGVLTPVRLHSQALVSGAAIVLWMALLLLEFETFVLWMRINADAFDSVSRR